jgi:predicted hydrocarbon binding protein
MADSLLSNFHLKLESVFFSCGRRIGKFTLRKKINDKFRFLEIIQNKWLTAFEFC